MTLEDQKELEAIINKPMFYSYEDIYRDACDKLSKIWMENTRCVARIDAIQSMINIILKILTFLATLCTFINAYIKAPESTILFLTCIVVGLAFFTVLIDILFKNIMKKSISIISQLDVLENYYYVFGTEDTADREKIKAILITIHETFTEEYAETMKK
jgi:hypothetical protein